MYIGYDFDETVRALSRIRDRYGIPVFQKFFEHVVDLCISAGLVWGKELYFDESRIEANADIDKRILRFHWEAQQHLKMLFVTDEDEQTLPEHGCQFLEKYNGQRLLSRRTYKQRTPR